MCANTVASHVMAMNTYRYIYLRFQGDSELAKLVGKDTMRSDRGEPNPVFT